MRLKLYATLLLGAAALSVVGAQTARAGHDGELETIVFASGAAGGYYHTIGTRLRAVLPTRQGPDVELLETRGSLENLALLSDRKSPTNLGLAQADALYRFLNEQPKFAKHYRIVADAGRECAVLIAGKGGPISSASDLQKKAGRTISVGNQGSGAEVTYETMSQIVSKYANTKMVNRDVMRSLLEIKSPGAGGANALMIVQRPRTLSPALEVLLDNLDVFDVIPIRKQDMGTTRLPDGTDIYSFENVTIGFGSDDKISFDTICTRAVLLANTQKLEEDHLEELSRLIRADGSYIMPGVKSK